MSGSAAARVDRDVRPARTPAFDARRCKQCGICAHVCPSRALVAPGGPALSLTPTLAEPEACSGCRACEYICPDFAVSMAARPAAAGLPRPAATGLSPSLPEV